MSEKPDPQWEKEKFKLGKDPFLAINEWSKALLAWQERLWAMCAIMEVELKISEGAFEEVLKAVRRGQHSPAKIRQILDDAKKHAGAGGALLATDVIGHPPDPPIVD